MVRRTTDRDGLARQLAGLPTLHRDALKQLWQELFGQVPPHKLGRKLMMLAIAYRLQERLLGGLKSSVVRQFARAAECVATGKPLAAPASVKPGTRLLREWQGTTHEVIVLDNGVRYQGKIWRSLSEVARAITGARWSGPRFFGLVPTNPRIPVEGEALRPRAGAARAAKAKANGVRRPAIEGHIKREALHDVR